MRHPHVIVVGSVNLDLVAHGARLPAPGETVTGATLARHPGGKGANQALAAQRLGARSQLLARVGRDAVAEEALDLLRSGGVDLSGITIDNDAATGVALIAVALNGENQIIVAPGANARFLPAQLATLRADAIICQLELPVITVCRIAEIAEGFLCINLAPAATVPERVLARADLLVLNDSEGAFYGAILHQSPALIAITRGARGATLWQAGRQIAVATPPEIRVVDSTGAGDAFVAALTVALVEGSSHAGALRFACAAGAAAASRAGAQPSLPLRAEVEALAAQEPA